MLVVWCLGRRLKAPSRLPLWARQRAAPRGCFFCGRRGFTLFRLTALRLPESELGRHREPITEADFRPTLAAGKLLDRISAQTKFPRTPDLTDWRFPGPRYIETCALNQAPPAFVLTLHSLIEGSSRSLPLSSLRSLSDRHRPCPTHPSLTATGRHLRRDVYYNWV